MTEPLPGKKTYITQALMTIVYGLGVSGLIPEEWQTTIMALLTGGAFSFLQVGMPNAGWITYVISAGLAVVAAMGFLGMISTEAQLQLTALLTGGATASIRSGVPKPPLKGTPYGRPH